jgi:hypothetical protein
VGGGRGRGAKFGTTTYGGRGNGEGEPWGDGNGALTAQGRERAREQEVYALKTANKNLRTRVHMLEVTARGFEGKEAVYARDRMEGNNMINQARARMGQAEKTIYELKKELEEKQLLLSGMYGEKVYQENKVTKVQDELEALKGDYDTDIFGGRQKGCITIHRGGQHRRAWRRVYWKYPQYWRSYSWRWKR